jgi:hypothetical protein
MWPLHAYNKTFLAEAHIFRLLTGTLCIHFFVNIQQGDVTDREGSRTKHRLAISELLVLLTLLLACLLK